MPPPAFLVEPNRLSAELHDTLSTAGLIESGNILHDLAAALTKIVFLFVRIHARDPFQIQSHAGRIISKSQTKPAETVQHLDRQRTDLQLVDIGPQRARGAEIIL